MKESLNKKITIFSPFLNPVGVKRATFALAKMFSKNGYYVDMLSVHKEWDDLVFPDNMKLTYLSTNFKNFPTKGFFVFRIVSLLIGFRSLFSLASFLRSNKPEILFVSMMPVIAWLGLKLSGKSKKINLVISIQGYPKDSLFRRIIWKKVFKESKDVVVESEGLMKKIKKMTGVSDNLSFVYNPHFEKQNEISAESKFIKPDYRYILGLGRLTKQKNFKLLIQSFSLIDDSYGVKLIIIGDGEERARLKKFMKKLKMDSKIKFLGNLEEPLGYLENAEMLVISSLWEGLPRVAIEAQALKTPIVSACYEGGLGEILMDGKAGIITRKNNVDDMKKAMDTYLLNPELASTHAEIGHKNLSRFSPYFFSDQNCLLLLLL